MLPADFRSRLVILFISVSRMFFSESSRQKGTMNMSRLMIFGGAVAIIATIAAATWLPRAPHYQFKAKSLSLETSGLHDQTGAELPFVTLRIFVPEIDSLELEFSQDPFEVECNVGDRWE